MQIEALGRHSAANAVSPSATAFVHRRSLHHMVYLNFWGSGDGPHVARANVRWVRDFYAAMRPHASGFAYQNYIDRELPSWRTAYYGRNWDRLRRIKRSYDPDWVFRFAQGIEPAR